MKKTNFDYVKVLTIAAIAIILILSFLPINPDSHYSGTHDPETHKAIIITEYKAFYTILPFYTKKVPNIGATMMVICFFLFYISSVLAIAFLLFNKNNGFKIAIAVATLCIVPFAGVFVYVSIFALIVTLVYIALFVISIINFKYKEHVSDCD